MNTQGRPPHPDILTPAEWRVLALSQHGLSNQQIADKLNVSINAIKFHISNIISKLASENDSAVTDKKSLLSFIGAPIQSAFHQTTEEVNIMNSQREILSIGQIARTVKDIKAAEKWYSKTLGLEHLYTYGSMAFFNLNGVRLFLSQSEEGQNVTDESIVYFQTGDIKASHQKLIQRGVNFTHAPHKVHTHDNGTEEWMAFFTDLEGRPLGLMGQY